MSLKDLILVNSDPITQNKLFVSLTEPGSKTKLINYYRISTIIILNQKPPQQFHSTLQYYVIYILLMFIKIHLYDENNPDYNYIHLFNQTTEEIYQSLSKGGVIIYCASPNLNASSSICIAFLMRYRDLNYEKAFYTLKYLNTSINPSINFRRQLQIYFTNLNKQKTNIVSQSPASLNVHPFIDGMQKYNIQNNQNCFTNKQDEFSFQNYDEKQNNGTEFNTIDSQDIQDDHIPSFNTIENQKTLSHSSGKAYLDAKKVFNFSSRVAKVITHNLSKSKQKIMEKDPKVNFTRQGSVQKAVFFQSSRLTTEPTSSETVDEFEMTEPIRKIKISNLGSNQTFTQQSIDTIMHKHQITILNLNNLLKKHEKIQEEQNSGVKQQAFKKDLETTCNKQQLQTSKKSLSFSNASTIKNNKPLWRDPINLLKNSPQIKEDCSRRLSVNDKALAQQRWRTQRLSVHQTKESSNNCLDDAPQARQNQQRFPKNQ